MQRIKIVGLALGAVLALGAMTASAASANDICPKMKGRYGGPVTISKCYGTVSGKQAAYKSATAPAAALFHGGTFVWSSSRAVTEFSITNVEDWGPYNCKPGYEEYRNHGEVTRTTTQASVSQVGEVVSFAFCMDSKNHKIAGALPSTAVF